MVLGRAYQQPQRRPMDLARHHLETIWQEKTTRETSQAVERRPGQILERHDMAEDSTRQGNMLRSSPNHGTQWLPNDAECQWDYQSYWNTTEQVKLLTQKQCRTAIVKQFMLLIRMSETITIATKQWKWNNSHVTVTDEWNIYHSHKQMKVKQFICYWYRWVKQLP